MVSREDTVVALTIHSGDRDDFLGPSADFTISLRKSLRNISQINVADVVIPKVQFLINGGNDTLVGLYRSPAGAAGVPFTIVLPHGDYGGAPATLAAGLKTVFDADPILGVAGIAPGGWTISYNATTRRITFAAATVGPVAPWAIQFAFTPLVDVIGLANAAALTDAELLLFVSANPAAAAVATNRIPALRRPMYYNITSAALTQDINTSYIRSETKSFDIGAGENVIDLSIVRDMTNTVHPNVGAAIPFGVVAFSADGKVMAVATSIAATGPVIFDNSAAAGFPAAWALRGSIPLPGDVVGVTQLLSWVAISADGATVAASNANDNAGAGAVWVFRWNGAIWIQQAKLLPTSAIGSPGLGGQICLSADGNSLSAGGISDNAARGAVWMYTRTGAVWTFAQKITVPVAAAARFGSYITMSADGGVVAAAADVNEHRVFVYRRAANWWGLEIVFDSDAIPLTPVPPNPSVRFGVRVCLSGDGRVLAAGTKLPFSYGGIQYAGGIFTYRYDVAAARWDGPQILLDPRGVSLTYSLLLAAGAALGPVGDVMYAFASNPPAIARSLRRYRAIAGPVGWELASSATGIADMLPLQPLYAAPDGLSAALNLRDGFFMPFPFAAFEGRVFPMAATVTFPPDGYLIGRLLIAMNAQMAPILTGPGAVTIVATFDEKSERVTLTATSTLTTGQGEYVSFTVAPSTTFRAITWPGVVAAAAQVSTTVDLSINNNVLRTIVDRDSSSADFVHSDTLSEDTRRYRAGFTIEAGAPVDIQLRDERDRVIDLDGANWVMTLLVEIHD